MSESKLIVGLGNPGKDYEYTRHNLGFLTVCRLAEKFNLKLGLSSLTNGVTAEGKIDQCHVWLLLPLTYMNKSGIAVSHIMDKKNFELKQVLVVCDDYHLDFGRLRLRAKGSNGGHNGLGSIIERLDSQNFARLRMGIGRPTKSEDVVNYVLGEFEKQERNQLDEFIERAVECCLFWLKSDVYTAMEQYNSKL